MKKPRFKTRREELLFNISGALVECGVANFYPGQGGHGKAFKGVLCGTNTSAYFRKWGSYNMTTEELERLHIKTELILKEKHEEGLKEDKTLFVNLLEASLYTRDE